MYPTDLKYSKEHEWAKIDGQTATIGITHFAQDSLGDVVYVELPKLGAQLKQMEEFGVVESVKTVSTLYAPLSGDIVAVNEELNTSPQLINDDPYGKGWIVKISLKDAGEVEKLLDASSYQAQLAK